LTSWAKPEQVLQAIPGFAMARVLGQLSDGPTNASYLLEQGSTRYVLRLDKPAAARLGLDRENEQQVYSALTASGLAPEAVVFDGSTGILLRPFLEGRSWTGSDLLLDGNLEQLATVLRKLHALPDVGKRFEPLAAAKRYAAELGTEQANTIVRQAEVLYADMELKPAAAALCHNDLLCQNILQTDDGQLVLIDWEYAAVGDPWFDLAIVIQHHRLDDRRAGCFVESYLGRPVTGREQEHLARQCRFYQHLLDLWNLL